MFSSRLRRCRAMFLQGVPFASRFGFALRVDAFAANCSSRGGLAYFGNPRAETRSVWLSGTGAGSFGLPAAQGNQTVNTWSKSKRGLHLSLSPVVSNANGGTHKLYDLSGEKPCLLDRQNQVRGLVPVITWPQGLPGNHLPRVFPYFALTDAWPDTGPVRVSPAFDRPDGRQDNDFPRIPPDRPDGRRNDDPPRVFPGFDSPAPSGPAALRAVRVAVASKPQNCIDPHSVDVNQRRYLPICPEIVPQEAATQGAGQACVHLTPGRDLAAPALWNFWSDIRFADISDERYDRDSDTLARSLAMGLDPRIADNLVLHMSFSLEDGSTDAHNGSLDIDTEGFSFGPYSAYRLSKHWAADASVIYGRCNNEVDLSVLSRDYDSQRLSGQVTLHGQYKHGAHFARPKASVNFAHLKSDGHRLSGNIFNFPVSVSLVLSLYGRSRPCRLGESRPFFYASTHRIAARAGIGAKKRGASDAKIVRRGIG
ncbi:autotransporter outer membrane beta-barrel domain-containing protein [Sinorhizobium meliloti]|nr:autotransporter outer membrane beta-barrel domain-containing protein [Sinorhizobium meliloti]